MIRYITLVLISVLTAAGAYSQPVGEGMEVTGTLVFQQDGQAGVTFRLAVPRKTVPRGRVLFLTPVITDGHYRISLTPVVVRGKESAALWARYERAAGLSLLPEQAIYTVNGQTLTYSAQVPFQHWMAGAELRLESLLTGCCGAERLQDDLLADRFLPAAVPEPEPVVEPEPTPGFIPVTAGDTLSLSFPFVRSLAEWREDEPLYDEDRESALIVYFRLDRRQIEPDYADNRQVLVNLSAAVSAILRSHNSKVGKIVIAGFSSPEGRFAYNDRLAWDRAAAVKRYLIEQTGIDADLIAIYNGSEDWRGLRLLVAASDLNDRAEIIRIIDHTPILSADGVHPLRLNEIRRLNGGTSYDYMSKHFFPV